MTMRSSGVSSGCVMASKLIVPQFLCGVTDDGAERRVDFEVVARGRDERHPDRRIVHGRPESFLALSERIFGLAPDPRSHAARSPRCR